MGSNIASKISTEAFSMDDMVGEENSKFADMIKQKIMKRAFVWMFVCLYVHYRFYMTKINQGFRMLNTLQDKHLHGTVK